MLKISSQIYLGKAKPSSGGGGASLPDQTGNAGKFLNTDGSNPSWANVNTNLPAFPAPSETVSTVAYTAAGGTSGILGKELQSITFDANDTALFDSSVSGDKSLSFYIGQGSTYDSDTDILLTFNFTVESGVVSYGELSASQNGSSYGSIPFIRGSNDYMPWDNSLWVQGVSIYWDSTNKQIWAALNFKANSLTDIVDVVDNVLVFEVLTQTNTLPAASDYANKLAYVYETGTYSDIKNLIYSNGTNWQFLPGAVLEIPDERMYEAANKLTPAYCGIALTTGQLAIPARNKSNSIQTNYNVGQMHEFYIDSSNWLNRYWGDMNFGTIFHGNSQLLTQEDEYSWIPEVMPNIYSSYTFINNGQTTYTQTVKVNLSNSANFCQWVFAQGTNKIKLQFENATNAKVFLNGSAVNTANDLLLDADSKTYIANFYDYSDSSGYMVMDIKELPYNPLPKVVDLGSISTTTALSTNTNYTATISGSAAFTLPTPADTTIANKITLSLNVLANSVINWGVNANAALAQFEPGKYQIRLLWNNTSSAWSAEVLKETAASSTVKLLVRFNGSISDESASPLTLTPSRTVTAFPVYAEGQYGAQKLTCTGDSPDNYVLASGNNLPKLDLGTGDFTIRCWLTLASGYSYPVRIFYKDNNNQISLGNDRIHIRIGGDLLLNQGFSGVNAGDTAYITLTRQNGVLYFFVNGTLVTSQASAEAWNLSDWTQIFKGSGVAGTGHYGIQELIVKNTCDYIASFTVPTAPFVLADSGVSDLHDSTKQDDLTTITGYDASKTQVLKNVQGVLTWVDEA